MRVTYTIIFVSDMVRSVKFYRDSVGLRVRFESPEWTEFDTEGATLALHSSRAAPWTHDDPDSLPPGRCRPGLGVPDLDAFHQRMTDEGVRCIQEPSWTFGARLALYADPDGLPISVGELESRERVD